MMFGGQGKWFIQSICFHNLYMFTDMKGFAELLPRRQIVVRFASEEVEQTVKIVDRFLDRCAGDGPTVNSYKAIDTQIENQEEELILTWQQLHHFRRSIQRRLNHLRLVQANAPPFDHRQRRLRIHVLGLATHVLRTLYGIQEVQLIAQHTVIGENQIVGGQFPGTAPAGPFDAVVDEHLESIGRHVLGDLLLPLHFN